MSDQHPLLDWTVAAGPSSPTGPRCGCLQQPGAGNSPSAHQQISGLKTVVCLHNRILHSRKKEGAPTLHNSMDGTGEHYAK